MPKECLRVAPRQFVVAFSRPVCPCISILGMTAAAAAGAAAFRESDSLLYSDLKLYI